MNINEKRKRKDKWFGGESMNRTIYMKILPMEIGSLVGLFLSERISVSLWFGIFSPLLS